MQHPLPPDWSDLLFGRRPTTAVILGSGLAPVAESFAERCRTPYSALPEVPETSVTGHHGSLHLCDHLGEPFIVASGRVHLYENRGVSEVVALIRYLHKIECKTLIISNAAGCCASESRVGEWMMIRDQINMTGTSPLNGSQFVDMSSLYDAGIQELSRAAASNLGMTLHEGVYLAVRGPQYETPAEVRAYRALGADAIGMSTALEAIQARALGMRVAGFSCLTNRAAGIGGAPLDHREVVETGRSAAAEFGNLLKAILPTLDHQP